MKSSRTRKLTQLAIITVVVLAVLFTGYKIYDHYNGDDLARNGMTAEEAKQSFETDATNKGAFIDGGTGKDGTETSTTPASSVDIVLTSQQETNGTVTIIAKLPGVSSGTCALTVTNGAKQYTSTVAVIYQAEFSTCAGYSIPVNELGTGTWNATLQVAGPTTGSKATSFEVK